MEFKKFFGGLNNCERRVREEFEEMLSPMKEEGKDDLEAKAFIVSEKLNEGEDESWQIFDFRKDG